MLYTAGDKVADVYEQAKDFVGDKLSSSDQRSNQDRDYQREPMYDTAERAAASYGQSPRDNQ